MPLYGWVLFFVFIVGMLILDLVVLSRGDREITFRKALLQTVMWVSFALIFNLGIYYFKGPNDAMLFLAGYLIEESLSVDNLFVFLLIFNFFKVPRKNQHKILFWGILGALVMRAFFIVVGIALVERFHFVLYIFAAFLIYAGVKLLFQKEDDQFNPENSIFYKWIKKAIPLRMTPHDTTFFVKENGKHYATTLFMLFILINCIDLVFAVDSIPAVLAISQDPFIVYTSNAFAILGLRSIYFVLSAIADKFHYLKFALAAILIFVGFKMLVAGFIVIGVVLSLGVIVVSLFLAILASVYFPPKKSISHDS